MQRGEWRVESGEWRVEREEGRGKSAECRVQREEGRGEPAPSSTAPHKRRSVLRRKSPPRPVLRRTSGVQ